jgi:hypothetical protein
MPIAVSMLMPISALLTPAITGLDLRFQASFQRSCSEVLQCQRQVTAHIAACKLTTGVGFIMGRQELGIGQQLINLTIAKDLLRRDRSSVPVEKNTGTIRPDGRPIQGDSCILQTNGYGPTLVCVFAVTKTKRLFRLHFFVRP